MKSLPRGFHLTPSLLHCPLRTHLTGARRTRDHGHEHTSPACQSAWRIYLMRSLFQMIRERAILVQSHTRRWLVRNKAGVYTCRFSPNETCQAEGKADQSLQALSAWVRHTAFHHLPDAFPCGEVTENKNLKEGREERTKEKKRREERRRQHKKRKEEKRREEKRRGEERRENKDTAPSKLQHLRSVHYMYLLVPFTVAS